MVVASDANPGTAPTESLPLAIALAIRYALSDAAQGDEECELIRGIYARTPTVEAVLTWRGSYNGHPYQGLDPVADATLIAAVSKHFDKLADPESRHWQWPLDQAARAAAQGPVEISAAANDAEVASRAVGGT